MSKPGIVLLYWSLAICLASPMAAEEYPGPDYALRNVLVKLLETGDVSTAARDEISDRLIGYWRQVDEELPAMTEEDERRVIAEVEALKGDEYQSRVLTSGYNTAMLHRFARQCAGWARLLNTQISKPDEALAWLRIMSCYTDNPGLFFRFHEARLARGNPTDIMRHYSLLGDYVSGPLVDFFRKQADEKTSR